MKWKFILRGRRRWGQVADRVFSCESAIRDVTPFALLLIRGRRKGPHYSCFRRALVSQRRSGGSRRRRSAALRKNGFFDAFSALLRELPARTFRSAVRNRHKTWRAGLLPGRIPFLLRLRLPRCEKCGLDFFRPGLGDSLPSRLPRGVTLRVLKGFGERFQFPHRQAEGATEFPPAAHRPFDLPQYLLCPSPRYSEVGGDR